LPVSGILRSFFGEKQKETPIFEKNADGTPVE